MNACRYEIQVAEALDERWRAWFEEFELAPGAGDRPGTRLSGSLPDQAALFGVLSRVRDLNLTLLEVRRVDDREKS